MNARSTGPVLALSLGLLAVMAGCAATPSTAESHDSSSAADTSPDSNNVQVSLAPTDNQGIVSVTLTKHYFNDAHRDACGGEYSVDADVDIGQVTDDSIEVRSVTYHYHPNAAPESPENFMYDYSNGTTSSEVDGQNATVDGNEITQTFQVNRVLQHVRAADKAGAILYTTTHLQIDDPFDACSMLMKIILQT